jgi:hypothetical protein
MVEVIGIACLVALVWLLSYGMSATDAREQSLTIRRAETPSQTKRAA